MLGDNIQIILGRLRMFVFRLSLLFELLVPCFISVRRREREREFCFADRSLHKRHIATLLLDCLETRSQAVTATTAKHSQHRKDCKRGNEREWLEKEQKNIIIIGSELNEYRITFQYKFFLFWLSFLVCLFVSLFWILCVFFGFFFQTFQFYQCSRLLFSFRLPNF